MATPTPEPRSSTQNRWTENPVNFSTFLLACVIAAGGIGGSFYQQRRQADIADERIATNRQEFIDFKLEMKSEMHEFRGDIGRLNSSVDRFSGHFETMENLLKDPQKR